MSERRDFMEALREQATRVRGGTWHVRRGAINWATHDFERRPMAMALLMATSDLLRPQKRPRQSGRCVVEAFVRLRAPDEDPSVDDAVLDDVAEDVVEVIQRASTTTLPDGRAVCSSLNTETSTLEESYDMALGIQGVIASFDLHF